MNRIFESLRPFIRWVIAHPGRVVLLALLMSVAGADRARHLSIDTDLANLIPPDYPSVVALEKLRDTVGGESTAFVAIESASFEANKRFAEVLIPAVLTLTGRNYDEPYFQRVDYRKDVTFLENNALYFATDSELDDLQDFLDSKIEEARLDANPFFIDLGDDDDEASNTDSLADELQKTYDEIVSKEYPISDDSTTLALQFYPSGSQSNIRFIRRAYADLDSLIESLQPREYARDMQVTTAGRLLRQYIEVSRIQSDVLNSFGSGVFAVLMMVVLYFSYKSYRARAGKQFNVGILLSELARMPIMAVLIGVPLIMSLSWTFGVAFLAYGKLNLMTSTLGLVLFGLGIDFGIHFYARYAEERACHRSVTDAAEVTFSSTGQAISVGAFTTAAALYVLVVADFRGFSQFGFIAGTGILFALVAMLVVLPALLSLMEKYHLLNLESEVGRHTATIKNRPFPFVRTILIGSLIAVVAALVYLPDVSFEYRFGKLEPTYTGYNARRDVVRRVFKSNGKRNPAYIVMDSPDEVPPVMDALMAVAATDTTSPTIRSVESLQNRFPLKPADQEERLERLEEIRDQLADPFIEKDTSEDIERLRSASSTTEAIAFDDVPEFLRKRFTSKSGELGNFVIIYPSVGLSDGRNSMAFSEDVGNVVASNGQTYHAGSTSLVAADMLKLMQREAPWMVMATFLIVVVLMLVNFGSVRWAIMSLIPLVVGVLWMLLLMEIFDLALNFYNLIVLPAVLGIGNDAGVHIVHRYREGGRGSMWSVVRSTGEHVTMGSLTTMIGFAGLILSFHPGLNTIGYLAIAGIGATLVTALVFLPALMQWLEDRESRPEVSH